MPSWGIHLVTSYAVANRIKIKDKNTFIIGNFLPDAERYVINDFSIYVPYNKSHFAKIIKINGVEEKLPDYNEFINKYRENLDNPIILGYLTHLLTDYYWNHLTFSKYTASNEYGEVTGVYINETNFLKGDKELRRILKQDDFANFDKEIIQTQKYELPVFTQNCMENLKLLEETQYNSNDILKIENYLKDMVNKKCKARDCKYKMFTKEKLNEYYIQSIEFIVNILNNL